MFVNIIKHTPTTRKLLWQRGEVVTNIDRNILTTIFKSEPSFLCVLVRAEKTAGDVHASCLCHLTVYIQFDRNVPTYSARQRQTRQDTQRDHVRTGKRRYSTNVDSGDTDEIHQNTPTWQWCIMDKRSAEHLQRLETSMLKSSLTGNRTRAAAVRAPNPNH